MRVLITGAAGFVGSHLAEALAGSGHEVSCLVRPGRSSGWLSQDVCTLVDCGMESPEAMKQAVADAEIVYHVAGVTKAFKSNGYFTGNVNIARNLVEAVRRYGRNLRALIPVSSQAAGGPHPGPVGLDGTESPAPVSLYGEAKLQAEGLFKGLPDSIKIAIVRPPMVYGPRDTAFVPLYAMGKLGFFPVPGNLGVRMSIVHVQDLVCGMTELGRALLDGRVTSGSIYYLSGQVATWEDIARAVGEAVGKRQVALPVPLWIIRMIALFNETVGRMGFPTSHLVKDKWREAKQSGWVCSHAKAASDFGYAPKIELQEGMRATVEWCRHNGVL